MTPAPTLASQITARYTRSTVGGAREARAVVRVPGSTSNLGAGFDCIGAAVDRCLTASVVVQTEPDATTTVHVAARSPRAGRHAGRGLDRRRAARGMQGSEAPERRARCACA